jgi:hypothetical protein
MFNNIIWCQPLAKGKIPAVQNRIQDQDSPYRCNLVKIVLFYGFTAVTILMQTFFILLKSSQTHTHV